MYIISTWTIEKRKKKKKRLIVSIEKKKRKQKKDHYKACAYISALLPETALQASIV